MQIVWDTIINDLPDLAKEIKAYLRIVALNEPLFAVSIVMESVFNGK